MTHGFVKVAAASPDLRVADCIYNAKKIAETAKKASRQGIHVLVTPELGITGYTCGDLFGQNLLLQGALEGLVMLKDGCSLLDMVLVVGLPYAYKGSLYNCAAVLHRGEVLGLVPKTHLPNYGEFYEQRQFTPAFQGTQIIENEPLKGVPFGANLLFQCEALPEFVLGVEICEDLWVPTPPSNALAQAGATIIANLSASDETIGKEEYRRGLVTTQSARLACGYVYADAGRHESTTDMVFAGHNLIAENGSLLFETPLFSGGTAACEIDVERLMHERRRMTTFFERPDGSADAGHHIVRFPMQVRHMPLMRFFSPTPFVPQDLNVLAQRCDTILSIQTAGLQKRLEHTVSKTVVVGLSGGLDSALAFLVAVRAFKMLDKPLSDLIAVSMPGFGTTDRTRGNADKLAQAVGAVLKTIDITETVRSHFKDIEHDENNRDVVYENAQARIRTLVLMDIANQNNGIVVGTGDLSELALGWATYNGDHMSMYAVNSSIPKTLVRYLVAYEADINPDLREVLLDILDTPVSPELLPAVDGVISQETESIVGPYELHDFTLYYALRWGYSPGKILRVAEKAFEGKYTQQEIFRWMNVFFRRFFAQQFKRSCLPDGPKVGSVSLSPRGDWRMPSDASAALWLRELERLEKEME